MYSRIIAVVKLSKKVEWFGGCYHVGCLDQYSDCRGDSKGLVRDIASTILESLYDIVILWDHLLVNYSHNKYERVGVHFEYFISLGYCPWTH